MSFNLKAYFERRAKVDLNTTTEGQLSNDGKAPAELQESQLDKSRGKEPTQLSEKQLEAARAKKDAPTRTTEGQLDDYGKTPPDNDGKSPGSTTEKQLKDNQVGGSTAPVEKRLDNVRTAQNIDSPRTASFNLKDLLAKVAAKKANPADQVTEGQLGKRKDKAPNNLTDKQLDAGRKDTKPVTTQVLLEKARTGEADRLVEARLDDSKSKFMKHRNPDAAKGDINKLEEQRLAAKKTPEKEKYEPASETDKKLMLPEIKGKDGLKTAAKVPGSNEFGHGLNAEAMNMLKQYDIGPHELFRYDDPNTHFKGIYAGIQAAKKGDNASLNAALEQQFGKRGWWQRRLSEPAVGQMSRTASVSKSAQFDEPFDIGFIENQTPGWDDTDPFVRVRPRIKDVESVDAVGDDAPMGRKHRKMINDLTRGVDVPSDAEVATIDEQPEADPVADDRLLPEEEDGGRLELPESFVEASVQDIDVGVTQMRQIVLSFDPDDFSDTAQVKENATGYLFSKHPTLFSFREGREPINVAKSMTVSMNDGKLTVTLPVAAFQKKERKVKTKAPQATPVPEAPAAATPSQPDAA